MTIAALLAVAALTAAPATAAEPCPNDSLRIENESTGLPDCRAYERVTPVFKDGANIFPGAVSADGTSIIAQALGAFAATKSEPFSNTEYRLARSSLGWAPTALTPTGSESPESRYYDSNADLTQSIWGQHRPDQSIYEEDLYLRRADGTSDRIGPFVHPPGGGGGPPSGTTTTFGRSTFLQSQYLGGSADLHHVFLTVEGLNEVTDTKWPGDGTLAENQVRSLYEYTGTGQMRPTLVGVDSNDIQISVCGTELGSGSPAGGDKYNAISADGTRVLFTARHRSASGAECATPEVDELYDRLDQTETISISEPLPSQCGRCNTASKQNAEFRGASENGSKIVFETGQELFGGQLGTNLYEYDFNRPYEQKVLLVSRGSTEPEVQGVTRVSEDGTHVYFVAQGILAGANREGGLPQLGGDNLYAFIQDSAHPGGRISFIATLCSGLEESGVVTGVAQCQGPSSDSTLWSAADTRPAQATPDGRYLVFSSSGQLTPDATGTTPQLFEYDSQEEALTRISRGSCPTTTSCGSSERFNGDGNVEDNVAEIPPPAYERTDRATAKATGLAISDNGRFVFFQSPAALTPGATEAASAGALSVYEYRSEGSITAGDVYLISDGRNATFDISTFRKGSLLLGSTASGSDVFFKAGSQLLKGTAGSNQDVFDARIAGGTARAVVPTTCSGEACQGAAVAAPGTAMPGTATFVGQGNAHPPHKKKHRHKKPPHKKGRSVPQNRTAHADRGGVR